MVQNIDKEQQQLYEWIDKLLWEEWDPIGVNDIPEAKDEYQSYTPRLFNLAIEGATTEVMAKELFQIEMHTMGLFGNRQRCELIAQKIADQAKNSLG
ncbi:hypothetical protein [Spirosoma koreense]